MDARAKHIEGLRQWARDQVAAGKLVSMVHASLIHATESVLSEFRTEHDAPGCRYWETWRGEHRYRFITGPGDRVPDDQAATVSELTRDEYLAREGLHFGYKDRL
jgi:hypothetical protein